MSLDTELPIFVRSAKNQYTRELLFSTPVNLMSLIFMESTYQYIHPTKHCLNRTRVALMAEIPVAWYRLL